MSTVEMKHKVDKDTPGVLVEGQNREISGYEVRSFKLRIQYYYDVLSMDNRISFIRA
jgi:hypothetical protein